MKRFNLFLRFTFCLLCGLVMTGCGDNPEQARFKLASLGFKFTPEDFIKCAARGDVLSVKLFLNAGIDINAKVKVDSPPTNVGRKLYAEATTLDLELEYGTKKNRTPSEYIWYYRLAHPERPLDSLLADYESDRLYTATALEIAVYSGSAPVVGLLLQHGGKPGRDIVLKALFDGNADIFEPIVSAYLSNHQEAEQEVIVACVWAAALSEHSWPLEFMLKEKISEPFRASAGRLIFPVAVFHASPIIVENLLSVRRELQLKPESLDAAYAGIMSLIEYEKNVKDHSAYLRWEEIANLDGISARHERVAELLKAAGAHDSKPSK